MADSAVIGLLVEIRDLLNERLPAGRPPARLSRDDLQALSALLPAPLPRRHRFRIEPQAAPS